MICESRSALQYACREASKRERMFIIGYRKALVSLKKVFANQYSWSVVEKLTRFSSRTTFNNRKSKCSSFQALQRRAIKITINKSATLSNHLAPVVQTLDSAIRRISSTEINYAIRWIVIYPVDSANQRLNNRGQTFS